MFLVAGEILSPHLLMIQKPWIGVNNNPLNWKYVSHINPLAKLGCFIALSSCMGQGIVNYGQSHADVIGLPLRVGPQPNHGEYVGENKRMN